MKELSIAITFFQQRVLAFFFLIIIIIFLNNVGNLSLAFRQ